MARAAGPHWNKGRYVSKQGPQINDRIEAASVRLIGDEGEQFGIKPTDQVAVIGIPHETWGEQVHAIVVLRADASATADELQELCRGDIAGYKVPKSIEFRTEPLPLSGALKILKRELRAPYWGGRDRAVN